ncbi:MAG: Lrp/AsnC family transcriptional regulator [Oxalobacteraceae bacterium]|nr:Lrp/AsnC family transcriptional regulator [Oxalobacteraceae bacterium]
MCTINLAALEFKLLNDFQRDFPLVTQPFAALAQSLDVDEATVIEVLQSMRQRGSVSRVGAVFRPNVVGVSVLAALAVSAERLEAVALQVNVFAEVNHNYEREHRFNLWFVATASSVEQLQAVLQKIETVCESGTVLVLPLLEQFHIDLGFDLGSACRSDSALTKPQIFQQNKQAPTEVAAIALSQDEQAFMAALQRGLPLVPRPFAQLGWAESDALATLARWCKQGVIKRFGVVVRHHELGFTANAMVVWNVPDALVSAVGRRIADSGRVSLCYRRPRCLPDWPYNLFCMIHGKDRSEVEQCIADLTQMCGLAEYPHSILFSRRRFKQCGAQYVTNAMNVTNAVNTANLTLPELAYGPD